MREEMNQIPCCYKRLEDITNLVNRLKSDGYRIDEELNDVPSIKEHIIAIIVDLDKRIVFRSNVTCMCCWSSGKRKPLYCHEVMENYEKLIIKHNVSLYNRMLESVKADPTRPGGMLIQIGKTYTPKKKKEGNK